MFCVVGLNGLPDQNHRDGKHQDGKNELRRKWNAVCLTIRTGAWLDCLRLDQKNPKPERGSEDRTENMEHPPG